MSLLGTETAVACGGCSGAAESNQIRAVGAPSAHPPSVQGRGRPWPMFGACLTASSRIRLRVPVASRLCVRVGGLLPQTNGSLCMRPQQHASDSRLQEPPITACAMCGAVHLASLEVCRSLPLPPWEYTWGNGHHAEPTPITHQHHVATCQNGGGRRL